MDQVSEIAGKVDGVDQVISISGVSALDNNSTLANAGVAYVVLKDWSLRGKGEDLRSLFATFNREFAAIRDARVVVFPPPPIQGIGNAGGFAMQLQLRDGSFDLAKLQSITNAVVKDAQSQTGLQRVTSSFRSTVPQIEGGGGSRQGRDLAGHARRRVLDARGLSGIELRRPVQQVRPHVPGLCAGGFRLSPAPRGHRAASGPQQAGQHDSARHHGVDQPGGGAVAAEPLQPLSILDGDGAAGGGLQLGRGHGPDGGDRPTHAAERHELRMDRDVVPGEAGRQPDLLHLRAGDAAGLPGAGRSVRKLVHAGGGASLRCRCRCWGR